MTQLAIGTTPAPAHKVRALAGVLAGFRWPNRGSFEKLTKKQQAVTLDTAALALEHLAAFPDD